MPNFWGPKVDKKVINSSTKCLISVKIAILTLIIPPPLVNVLVDIWLAEYFNWVTLCVFRSQSMLSKSMSFVWMGLQPAADPYNVVYKVLQTVLILHVSYVIYKWEQCHQHAERLGMEISTPSKSHIQSHHAVPDRKPFLFKQLSFKHDLASLPVYEPWDGNTGIAIFMRTSKCLLPVAGSRFPPAFNRSSSIVELTLMKCGIR